MRTEDYVDYWTRDRLAVWDAASLEMVRIPPASKEFLQEIGMPLAGRWMGLWMLSWDMNLSASMHLENMRVIGNHCDSPWFYVEEGMRGRVYESNVATADTSNCFVNSSIRQFAFSLTAMHRREGLRYDDPNYARIVAEFEADLIEIDAFAMSEDGETGPSKIYDWRLEGGLIDLSTGELK